MVDSTFNTPIIARPLEMGATVVVHSATKYLSGHSDLLMGVAVARDAAVVERLVSYRSLQGAVPGSIEAWLALRGLRTLHLRMDRAQASAAVLADQAQPARESRDRALSRVRCDGQRRPERGRGRSRACLRRDPVVGARDQPRRRRVEPRTAPAVAGESSEVPETLVRLSVGIEDVDDLWNDLATALERS